MKKELMAAIMALVIFMLVSPAGAQDYNSKSTLPGSKATQKRVAEKKGKSNVESVIIVYKTHFDIGYSELVHQVLHDYRTSMTDKVLEAIDRNSSQPKEKQFVWTLSGWPMKQILWEGQAPERRSKIEQSIAAGNLAIHAFPFTMHTETSEMEDLVRGLGISSGLARKYNQPLSISAKMTDVPGQSWFIPTLFTNAGIRFYHMGGPVVNFDFNLPPFFWWEGPDGSRLLTLYKNGYGTDPLPPADWPFKTWLYINMTGDNQGPPDPATVSKDLEFYAGKGIKARVGRMDDFAEEIMKEDLSRLPIIRTDISDPWIHGAMSMPEASKNAHNVRPSIGALDQLSTLESIWGIYRPDLRTSIASAYENSLLYSEHTWGLANQHYLKVPYGKAWNEFWEKGLPPQYRLMEESWRDQAGYIDNVQKLVTIPYKDAVATLADNVNLGEKRVVVYNPLPWKRDGIIELDTRLTFGNNFVSIRPVDGGPLVAVAHEYPALENKAPMSRFVVTDIPPMGYRTYVASTEKAPLPELKADREAGVIESPFFRAKLNPSSGRIESLINKKNGQELVDQDAPRGFGQYFYERFDYKQIAAWLAQSLYPQYMAHRFCFAAYDMPQDVPYSSASPENMSFSVEQSEIDVKAVMTGILPGPGEPQRVSIALVLSGSMPTAEIEVSWQKQPDTWPETAWLCLPFRCDNATFRLGRLGAVVDPVRDIKVENANNHLWWINTGVAVLDSVTGAGYGISSKDAPLVSLGEPGEYKFSRRYEPRKPYIYLNLYNNHWRTNFPAWIGDGRRMSARVCIWTFDKYDNESALYTPSMENRVPLMASVSKAGNGRLPVTRQGISLSRKGVSLTAFGPNPDGEGTLLRVWDQSGSTGRLEITLPEGAEFTTAVPVNLRGETAGKPVSITVGKMTVDLKAWGPLSLILK